MFYFTIPDKYLDSYFPNLVRHIAHNMFIHMFFTGYRDITFHVPLFGPKNGQEAHPAVEMLQEVSKQVTGQRPVTLPCEVVGLGKR